MNQLKLEWYYKELKERPLDRDAKLLNFTIIFV